MPGSSAAIEAITSARAADIDTGEPVDDPPPFVEPTEFYETAVLSPGQRPPRRMFLAPVVPAAARSELSRQVAPFEIPMVIEPVAALPAAPPAPRRAATLRRLAMLPRRWLTILPRQRLAFPRQWLARARAALPAGRRRRLTLVAGAVAAIVLIAGLADIAGIGPFSPARHYPPSAAPSDPALRFAYYRSGAQAGDADAQLRLAILYAKGEGAAQDYAMAATWFRAAADQGVARAQYDLGVLYERGRGVPVDLTEAATWYLKAAEGKFPLAEYNLAVCYTKGQGIRKDLPEAVLWYRRAAGQGVVQAMINLGMMYEQGDGIALSPVDAYAWYRAAGRRGNQAASQRADDVFASMPHLDQIRAEALASDVDASIHEPERGDAAATNSDAPPGAPPH